MEFSRLRLGYCRIVIAATFLISLSPPRPAHTVEPVDDGTCLTCHENADRSLAPTPHRLSSQIENPEIEIGCTSCHGSGDAHIDDPSKENITNPAVLAGRDAIAACTRCHAGHDRMDDYGFEAHSSLQLNCADCHRVHGGGKALLLDQQAEFCLRCHEKTRMDFKKVSNHPVLQQNITCLSCHRLAKRADQNIAYDLSGPCRECHVDQAAPHLYEHEALNAYSLEGSGCVECHEPHGSENDRLLKQPGNRLCMQCHYPAGHMTAHGGIWAKYACQQCHKDTHGSFVSSFYLDPDLPAKFSGDCFNAGCHSLTR
ncbi:MAG: cytochrome c3 family protein [Chitinivibrionia bacterium]|nr:cytochrome c3 family protein [Chitinivibrionia bacterium]